MGIGVLIIGKSGSGKSASMRNISAEWGVINVLGKPLPFRSTKLKTATMDDYSKIEELLVKSKAKSIVIDDAGYLITKKFMTGHSAGATGSGVYELYNDIADRFYHLLSIIPQLPDDKIVYILMHEDKNDAGDVKPKTIGKMLDDKVCVEGMFSIVLRCESNGEKHFFRTVTDGYDVTKTPMGMFEAEEIDNDLKAVDDTIRNYYFEEDKQNG